MTIAYRSFRLSSILAKLSNFLLLKRKFSYDPTKQISWILPSILSKVFYNLPVFKKQEGPAQFPER